MRAYLQIILIFAFCSELNAQSLQEFNYLGDPYGDGHIYLGVVAGFSNVSNWAAPHADRHLVYNTFSPKIDMRRVSFEPGAMRYYGQYKLLGDLLFIVNDQINGNGSSFYRQESSGLTNGVLGWHSWGVNVWSSNRLCLAIGLNLNDYFIGTTYEVDSIPKRVSLEPEGYYFGAGPAVFADVLLQKHLILHVHSSYTFNYWRPITLTYASNPDEDMPMPHLGGFSAELMTSLGLFAGLDYNWLINRTPYPNSTKRWDYTFGFRFVL